MGTLTTKAAAVDSGISKRNEGWVEWSTPALSVAWEVEIAAIPAADVIPGYPSVASRTVLIVDEAPGVRSAMRQALRTPSMSVLTSPSAERAWTVLREWPVDLVIVDQGLTGKGGIEFLQKLRTQYPDVKRALLTGHCDFPAVREAINRAGVALFLSKPWETQTLQKLVENLLEENGAHEISRPEFAGLCGTSGLAEMTLAEPGESCEPAELDRDALYFVSRVFQRINAHDQETEILRALANELARFLPGAELWWMGHDCESLRILSGDGAVDEHRRMAELDDNISAAIDCAQHASNAISIPLEAGMDETERLLLAMPIRMGNRRIGVMGIVGPATELLRRVPLELIRLIADPLANAVGRCRLGESVQAEQEWWGRVFDAIDSPVVISDESHSIHFANRAAREKIGIEFGRPRDLCCEGESDSERCPLLEASSKNAVLVSELREAFGRSENTFEVSSFPIAAVPGSECESRVVQIFRDTTQEREAQNKRVRTQQLSALGALAAGVAHEIRNPLAAMMNAISLIKTSAAEGTEEFELAQIVLEECRRVNRIVGDFLSFARPNAVTAGSSESTRVDVLIASTATLVRKDPRFSHGIELQVCVEADLPDLRADQDRIRQVLWNLLLNAGQAVEGKGSVVVGARAQQRNGKPAVLLYVEDSGPGIPEEMQDRAFEPFETTKPNGTGLGLSLARHIVESYAGEIFIESSELGGAKLCITLPPVSDKR